MGNQVFEPDWIEGGFYGQVMTGGICIAILMLTFVSYGACLNGK
jgi:hypothetical protein